MDVKKNWAKYIIIAAALGLWAYFFFGAIVPSELEVLSSANGADFVICYQAAGLMSQGQGGNAIYNQNNLPDTPAADPAAVHMIDYVYPPLWAWLLIPLSKFTAAQALAIWRLLSVLFLMIAIWLLGKINFPPEIWQRHRQVVIVSLLGLGVLLSFSWPGFFALLEGQVIILLLLLLVLTLWTYGRRHKIWGALALALAGAIKIFPLFVLFYFLVKKNIRWVLFVLLFLVLLTLLPLPWAGLETYRAFIVRDVFLASAPPNVVYNQGLPFLLTTFFSPSVDFRPLVDWSPAVPYLKAAASCLVLIFLWRQLRQTQNLVGGFSLTVIAILLIWPVTWVHTYVLLLIPLFFMAGVIIRRKFRLPLPVWMGLAAIIFIFMTPWPMNMALLSPWLASSVTLAAIGLWVAVSWALKQECRGETKKPLDIFRVSGSRT